MTVGNTLLEYQTRIKDLEQTVAGLTNEMELQRREYEKEKAALQEELAHARTSAFHEATISTSLRAKYDLIIKTIELAGQDDLTLPNSRRTIGQIHAQSKESDINRAVLTLFETIAEEDQKYPDAEIEKIFGAYAMFRRVLLG